MHHGDSVVIRYLFIHSESFVLSPIVVRPRKPVAAIQEVTPTASIISMGNMSMMLKGCAFLLCPGEVRVCFVILAAFEPIAAINAGEGAGAASDDRGWENLIPGQYGLLLLFL